MSNWREDVHGIRRHGDTQAHTEQRGATMQAWLENRAYSTWPKIETWEVRVKQIRWQSQLMRQVFTSKEIHYALYVYGRNYTTLKIV